MKTRPWLAYGSASAVFVAVWLAPLFGGVDRAAGFVTLAAAVWVSRELVRFGRREWFDVVRRRRRARVAS
jgi:hypothetical protein